MHKNKQKTKDNEQWTEWTGNFFKKIFNEESLKNSDFLINLGGCIRIFQNFCITSVFFILFKYFIQIFSKSKRKTFLKNPKILFGQGALELWLARQVKYGST